MKLISLSKKQNKVNREIRNQDFSKENLSTGIVAAPTNFINNKILTITGEILYPNSPSSNYFFGKNSINAPFNNNLVSRSPLQKEKWGNNKNLTVVFMGDSGGSNFQQQRTRGPIFPNPNNSFVNSSGARLNVNPMSIVYGESFFNPRNILIASSNFDKSPSNNFRISESGSTNKYLYLKNERIEESVFHILSGSSFIDNYSNHCVFGLGQSKVLATLVYTKKPTYMQSWNNKSFLFSLKYKFGGN